MSTPHALDPYEQHWNNRDDTYVRYPTVRHRHRLVLKAAYKAIGADHSKALVFDYGCGVGLMLDDLRRRGLLASQLAGNDLSHSALAITQAKIPDCQSLFLDAYPQMDRRHSLILCSEVIEHSTEYAKIIDWISDHMAPGGTLVLSTQGGPRFGIDDYSGHTQHFSLDGLKKLLENSGLDVQQARRWGFPFFSLQKRVADLHFDGVRQSFLEARPSRPVDTLFKAAYAAYFLHDAIPFGPQLFLVARKSA